MTTPLDKIIEQLENADDNQKPALKLEYEKVLQQLVEALQQSRQ